MTKHMIASEELLEVGQVYQDLSDLAGAAHPEQTFLVTRASTQREWEEFVASSGGKRDWSCIFSSFPFHFYEVQTD